VAGPGPSFPAFFHAATGHQPSADQARIARRLLYVLPPRSLAEPLAGRLRTWLANLDLTEEVALHLVRGAAADSSGDWREDMHRPAIVLGEASLLVSKAL
jgi:CRISPR-associated endonuclease/helicase Cas3